MKILASLFVPMLILASVNAKADADSGSRITLSAAAQVEVANDEVAILYQIEAQGFDVDVECPARFSLVGIPHARVTPATCGLRMCQDR